MAVDSKYGDESRKTMQILKSYLQLPVVMAGLALALNACDTASFTAGSANEPEAPPPPTASEIAQQIMIDAGLNNPLPRRSARVAPQERQALLAKLASAKTTHSATDTGRDALVHVVRKVESRLREAQEARMWEHVMLYISAYEVFYPDAKKYTVAKDQAMTELRKPVVTVKGLPLVEGRKVAMLRFYLPLTGASFEEEMRIGEEAHGMKLIGIVGEDRGVDLRYLETGEVVRSLLKRAR